ADYRQPRSYDVLSLDPARGLWENCFPPGKDWGPLSGPCRAPGWKDERFGLRDAEGTCRPNWTVYGTFSLGQKYDYDPDTRAFYSRRRRPPLPLRPGRPPLGRPGAGHPPGEGAGRHAPVGLDVLRPAQQAFRPLRRRQRADPARRPRHLDLLPRHQHLGPA